MEYFYLDESTIHPGLFCLRLNNDNPHWRLGGRVNYNILPSRMLDMFYPGYLEYCQNYLGASIFGKDCEVPYPLFQNNQATKDFVVFLNEQTEAGRDNWLLITPGE